MTITLLHGWAIDPENEGKWEQFRTTLKRKGFDTRFLPLPGLSTPLDTVWGLNDYVQWLQSQLKSSGKTILLGHSFGGQLAARFAAQYPDRVAALVLVDSAGIRDRALPVVLKRTVFKLVAQVGKLFTQAPWFRQLLYKLARERDYLQASPVLRRTMAAVLADEVIADLPKISAPTCIIWGERDTATPLKLAFRFSSLIKNSQLHIVSGARHSPQFTHPTVTAEYVAAFLHAEFGHGGRS